MDRLVLFLSIDKFCLHFLNEANLDLIEVEWEIKTGIK